MFSCRSDRGSKGQTRKMSPEWIYNDYIEFVEEKCEDFSSFEFNAKTFDFCVFSSCIFRSSSLVSSSFLNVKFIDCDLSQANFQLSHLTSVEFIRCKLSGTSFLETKMKNTKFAECNFMYATLTDSILLSTTISSSSLLDCALESISGKKIVIERSKLSGSSLKNTCLSLIDFKGSDLSAIYLSDDRHELKGSRLDVSQALDIIRGFSVDIY